MLEKKKDLLAIILVLVTVFSAYLNTLPNSFIFDDRHMIMDNPYIKHLRFIPLFFKGEITSIPIVRGMYRPILMLSFTLNYLFTGLLPCGYHLVNISLHFLNAYLLYLLLKLFLKDLNFYLRLGLTLIFSLHPINTEAVAYISSRSTTLCSFFILSSFYAYLRWRLCGRKQLYFLSLGTYILALLTKEIGLILPVLITAYEFVYGEKIFKNLKRFFLRLFPFILVTFGYLILIKILLGSIFGLFSKFKTGPPLRPLSSNILTQSAVSFFYLYLFFLPFNLCIEHNFPIIKNFVHPLGGASLVLIFSLVSACLFLRKRHPLISFSCFWYFISLLPQFYSRLNLVAAEHHAYLAFFSLYFIFGYLLTRYKIEIIYLRQLFFLIAGLFFILTLQRNFQWRNDYLFWRSTLKVNPHSGIAQGSLGLYLANRGFIKEAKAYLEYAATQAPLEITRKTSLLNLASFYAKEGQPEKGLKILRENRDFLWQTEDIGYLRVEGYIYRQMGDFKRAKEIWEKAWQYAPQNAQLESDLGWLYLENLGDRQKAKEYFQMALKDNPDLAAGHFGLGLTLEKEDLKEAIKEFKKTIELSPESFEPYYKLGIIYATTLLDSKAERYFKKTIELSPNFSPAYYSLCVFYLSLPNPDYKNAREYFEKAKSLGYKVDSEIEEKVSRKF